MGQIIEDVAPFVGIEKSKEQLEKDYRYGDPITVKVPNFIGQTKDDIAKQFYPFRIEWHGEGPKLVISYLKWIVLSNKMVPFIYIWRTRITLPLKMGKNHYYYEG